MGLAWCARDYSSHAALSSPAVTVTCQAGVGHPCLVHGPLMLHRPPLGRALARSPRRALIIVQTRWKFGRVVANGNLEHRRRRELGLRRGAWARVAEEAREPTGL